MEKLKTALFTILLLVFTSPTIYASSCYVTNTEQNTGEACFEGSGLLFTNQSCSLISQDSSVTATYSSGACPTGAVCKINLSDANLEYFISYYNINITQQQCNDVNGIFSGTTNTVTPTPTPSSTPSAHVQNITGQPLSVTLVTLDTPTTSVSDVTALVTDKDSSTTIKRDDGTIVEIKQETIALLNPAIQATNTITLIRGEVTTTVDCSLTNDYEVRLGMN